MREYEESFFLKMETKQFTEKEIEVALKHMKKILKLILININTN